MNLVAHQFLSFNQIDLQKGNLLGEVIHGKKYLLYPDDIAKGILLHRFIDSFTDVHPLVKSATSIFHKTHGKFSPVIVDVVFDYFLIKNWSSFSDESFIEFKKYCYFIFKETLDEFPLELQYMLAHLLQHDWFHRYQSLDGIQTTLRELGSRTSFPNNMNDVLPILHENHDELESIFLNFFPELITQCQLFLQHDTQYS